MFDLMFLLAMRARELQGIAFADLLETLFSHFSYSFTLHDLFARRAKAAIVRLVIRLLSLNFDRSHADTI